MAEKLELFLPLNLDSYHFLEWDKLEFFTVRSGFLSLFGMRSTKKMPAYSDQMAEKLELFLPLDLDSYHFLEWDKLEFFTVRFGFLSPFGM